MTAHPKETWLRDVFGLESPFRQRRRFSVRGVGGMDGFAFRSATYPSGFRIAGASLSGGMVLALAMNRRARGLRGLDVLRRSQDRAPPQFS